MSAAAFRRSPVCPWWFCFTFDNPVRRLFHKPEDLLKPFLREGDRAIDIGPGMGYFTVPAAKLVGPDGRVTAIDVQEKMLSALVARAERRGVAGRIQACLGTRESLGKHEPADFILAFWMVHEVPDRRRLLSEIRDLLKPGGRFLLVEPKIHVGRKDFEATIGAAEALGFAVLEKPRIRLSRSALLTFPGRSGASSDRA